MNNLKLSWEVRTGVQLQREKGEEFLRLSAVDIERNRLFFASSANFIYTTQLPSPQVNHLSLFTLFSFPTYTSFSISVPTYLMCLALTIAWSSTTFKIYFTKGFWYFIMQCQIRLYQKLILEYIYLVNGVSAFSFFLFFIVVLFVGIYWIGK